MTRLNTMWFRSKTKNWFKSKKLIDENRPQVYLGQTVEDVVTGNH